VHQGKPASEAKHSKESKGAGEMKRRSQAKAHCEPKVVDVLGDDSGSDLEDYDAK